MNDLDNTQNENFSLFQAQINAHENVTIIDMLQFIRKRKFNIQQHPSRTQRNDT